MILITKIEQSEYNQKLLQSILNRNLNNQSISNIVIFTNTDYVSNNKNITVINEITTEYRCIEKTKHLFTDQILCFSKWDQIFNTDISMFNKNQETLYSILDDEYSFIIFNKVNFVKEYTKIIDCLIGKKIDISERKISQCIYLPKNNKDVKKTEEVIRKKGVKYTPPPINVYIKRIDTIIISVDYNDTLSICLSHNRKYLENITVVTSSKDEKCQEICESFNVNCIITEKMYENGSEFNKGKAINEGIRSLTNPDWILILDADIILTENICPVKLEKNIIYSSSRYICSDYESFQKWKNNILQISQIGEFNKDRGLGFFQLFNFEKVSSNLYPEDYSNGSYIHQDIKFLKYFDKYCQITESIHLGRNSINWRGRKTKNFTSNNTSEIIIDKPNKDVLKKSNRVLDKDPKLAVITTFFNPKNYTNIKYNYSLFSKAIKEKADLFTIELSFDDNFYTDENTIKIKGNKSNILWQKERMLNILLEKIPKEYTNIAWVDCDILFQNENWVEECNQKLQDYKVLQLYQYANRIDSRGEIGIISKGIINRINEIQKVDLNISLGIPGFAWAARREVLEEIGFLDTQIIGGGDSLMCNSFLGSRSSVITKQMNQQWLDPYIKWADKSIKVVDKSVNFISGTITHLYHGSMPNRNYNDRYNILSKYNFDPITDLKKDKNGLWRLKNKSIEKDLQKYFEDRNEDDNIIDINTYFDKIFVVNLDRRKDKLKKVDSKLKSLKIKYERFSAIDGSKLGFDNSKFIPGKGMIENKFALGCLLSHLEIIKKARENNYKRILIFEDDVLISENIKVLIQKLRKIESWKLLYLGTSQYDWNIEMSNEDFYLSKKCLGTFAYAIDNSSYDEIIEMLESSTKSVDNILSIVQENNYGQCFTFYPNICIADVSESEIREERDNTKHSVRMRWNLIKNYI